MCPELGSQDAVRPISHYQNDIGKELDTINRVRGKHQIVYSLSYSQQEGADLSFMFSEDSTNYVVVLGRLISIQHKAKVLSVRNFTMLIGLFHKVGATFPVTNLSRNLWLSIKDVLGGVL